MGLSYGQKNHLRKGNLGRHQSRNEKSCPDGEVSAFGEGPSKCRQEACTLKAISHSELYERSRSSRERIDHIRKRKSPRARLTIRVPIYEFESGDKGILRDISEKGMRVAGIEARVGQAKTFQIPVDMYVESDPLLVLAECKWVELRQGGKEYFVAGFEITDVTESDSEKLQNFIGWLLFSESGHWQTIG